MTRDFRHWWSDDDGDAGGGAPRRPPPGKVTLTQSIPVQRRAKPDARPAQKTPLIEAFGFVQAGGEVKEPAGSAFPDQSPVSWLSADADQACRAAFDFDFAPVQRAAARSAASDTEIVHGAAARGLEVPSQGLPHFEQIQKSFGKHDVSHVQAHVGGAAAEASTAMGAEAYATGEHVAFASAPDLHTAAHEAAHVVQQKGGVQLKGGVGEAGDAYEQHADAVADKVVAGESAEMLLDEMAGGASSAASTVQMKKGDGPATPATASSTVPFASPMTELATHAQAVVEAAEFAMLPFQLSTNPPDSELATLNQRLVALATFLHQHARERTPSDKAAVQAALKAADGVAKLLKRDRARYRRFEAELAEAIDAVNRVVSENDAREAKLESPAALAAMNEESRGSIVRWKLFADAQRQALPGIAADSLNEPVVTATAWGQRLERHPDSVEDLARAIVDQHEVVILVDAELSQVLRQPVSETTTETINAYLHVLVISSGRRQRSDEALELARAKRRRLPLDRAEAALKSGEQHMLNIERRDPAAGREARADLDELRSAHKSIENTIAKGKSPDPGDLEDFVLETREYEFLHRIDLLRLQAKQALDAIDQIKAQRTAEKVKVQRRLRDLIQTLDADRGRYKDTAFEAKYEQPEEARAKKKEILRYSEIQLQNALKAERYEATLEEAKDVLDDQIVDQFLSQLIWTVALTISGNFVAAAARGAAASVGARMGASLTATTRVASIVANVSEGTYGAFTQKYIQGDQGSLTTLLAVNILTPFAVDRVMRLGRTAERIGEGAADAAAKSERMLDDAAKLSQLDDVVLDADELVTFSARMEKAAKKSAWVRNAKTGALGIRTGVNLTAEMIMGAAVDYAIRRAKDEGGRPPSDQTAAEWLMQGASIAIGRHISVNVRAVRSRLAAVETGASSATASLLKLADTVAADAKALEEGGPHTAVPEVANNYAKVLAEEQAYFEKELTDAIDGRGKRSRKQILGLLAGNRRATGELGKLASGELATVPAANKTNRGKQDGAGQTADKPKHDSGAPDATPQPDPASDGGTGVRHADSAAVEQQPPPSTLQWDGFRFVAEPHTLSAHRDAWIAARPHDKVSKVSYDAKKNAMSFEVRSGKQRFRVEADLPPRIQDAADLLTLENRIIGTPVRSESTAIDVLRHVSRGNFEALKKLGVKVPPGLSIPDGTEFGIGMTPDRKYVLVRGQFNGVTWGQVPGITPIAHTHPSTRGNDLQPLIGRDRISVAELLSASEVPNAAREVIFPSPSDIRIMARLGIDGHRVVTAFVVHDGHVVKAQPGDNSPPLEWVIGKPREVGRAPDGHVVYEWTVVGEVNGKPIGPPKKVWSAEPPGVELAKPGVKIKDFGSHYLAKPELMPPTADGKPPSNPETTTRASTPGEPENAPDPVELLNAVSKITGVPPNKLSIEAHAQVDDVSVRAVGDGIEVRFKTGVREDAIAAAVQRHVDLVATHGGDAVRWAGESLDGANASRLLGSVNATALAGLRDVSAADALKNVDVFGSALIESSVPPMTGRYFSIERTQLGEKAAAGIAQDKVHTGKVGHLAAHASNLDAMAGSPRTPLGNDSLIVDANILAAIKEMMAGTAWHDLQAQKQTRINYLRARAKPPLPPLTGDPPGRDLASIIGHGHDLRAANAVLGESAPMPGLERQGFALNVDRDSPRYSNVLDELAQPPLPIGGPSGIGDRAIVADAVFAAGEAQPTLMTGDKKIVERLYVRFGPGKNDPIKQKGKQLWEAILLKHGPSFEVDVPDGAGKTRRLTIVAAVR